MSESVIDLDAHRPGWRVVAERCGACGHRWISVKHPQCPETGCECSECGAMASEPDEETRRLCEHKRRVPPCDEHNDNWPPLASCAKCRDRQQWLIDVELWALHELNKS